MKPNPTLAASTKFHCLMEGLFSHVRNNLALGVAWIWGDQPFLVQAFRRCHRLNRRFAAIMARFHAGTLPPPGSSTRRHNPRTARPPRPRLLPTRKGWALRISHAVISGYELEQLVEDPDIAAAVAAVPQLGRVFRPLCHALAVKQPAWLRLPVRPRAPRPPRPRPIIIRLGAGDLWRGPSGIWPDHEVAKKFDAKVRVWPHELEKWP